MSKRARTKAHRKIYESWYGIKIPVGFDIHHIDFNRDNNDPKNLLMLPSELHHRYHQSVLEMFRGEDALVIRPQVTLAYRHQIEFLLPFASALNECAEWIFKRDLDRLAVLHREEAERWHCSE